MCSKKVKTQPTASIEAKASIKTRNGLEMGLVSLVQQRHIQQDYPQRSKRAPQFQRIMAKMILQNIKN